MDCCREAADPPAGDDYLEIVSHRREDTCCAYRTIVRLTHTLESEHRVVVRRGLGHGLDDVPVLDDLAVPVEAEEIGHGAPPVARLGRQVAVWVTTMLHSAMTRLMSTNSCGFCVVKKFTKSMNAWKPSAACGLCWMYSSPP